MHSSFAGDRPDPHPQAQAPQRARCSAQFEASCRRVNEWHMEQARREEAIEVEREAGRTIARLQDPLPDVTLTELAAETVDDDPDFEYKHEILEYAGALIIERRFDAMSPTEQAERLASIIAAVQSIHGHVDPVYIGNGEWWAARAEADVPRKVWYFTMMFYVFPACT